jgi:hypothetical protein
VKSDNYLIAARDVLAAAEADAKEVWNTHASRDEAKKRRRRAAGS